MSNKNKPTRVPLEPAPTVRCIGILPVGGGNFRVIEVDYPTTHEAARVSEPQGMDIALALADEAMLRSVRK